MANRYPAGLVDALTGRRYDNNEGEADLARDGDGWVLTGGGEIPVLAEPASATATSHNATAFGSGQVDVDATTASATASAQNAKVGLSARAATATATARAVSGDIDPLPPSAWLKRFRSYFPGGTMLTRPGNGTVTEAGGVVTLTCGSGINCSAYANNPFAYRPLRSLSAAFDTVLRIETRLYNYTASGSQGAGLSVFQDSSNAYLIQFYAGNSYIYISRIYGGSGDNPAASVSAVSPPSTNPHTYRIYINPTARALFVQEADGTNLTINGNEIQFWYRVGDAGTWTWLYSRQLEWPVKGLSAGPFSYNGSPWPAGTALYNYFLVYQWDASKQRFVPANENVPLTSAAVDPTETMALEDAYRFIGQSGEPDFDSPDQLRGPISTNEQQSRAALEDGYRIAPQGGQPLAWMPDGLLDGGRSDSDILALEDTYACLLSLDPEFSTGTQDIDLHYHFTYNKPYIAFAYDTTGEAWANPTTSNFTGYARDGYRYTNGVKDSGPVSAPWRTEASSANRSSRPDFPNKALLVVTLRELVIFDLDTYNGNPPNLRVWMRFLLGNDASNFWALGRGVESILSVGMKNGLLAVGTQDTGWEVGGLITIDFRATTTATTFSMVRSDGQWIGNGTKTIVDRNTTSCYLSSGSYRLDSEKVFSLSMLVEGTLTHIAVGGEDMAPQVLRYSMNTIQYLCTARGDDIGDYDQLNYRHVHFDDVGWLWFSIGNRLYRNCNDWREGYILPQANDSRQGSVALGADITKIAAAGNNVYCATSKGVYCVPKGSMAAFLAYTVAGGGGGGRLNAPPAGEILPGLVPNIQALRSYTLILGTTVVTYIVVGTWIDASSYGSFSLIRTFDDVIIKSLVYPNFIEPGTYISTVVV